MKRVVITGLGTLSSIGNSAAEAVESLKSGKSGIEFIPQYAELGFRSHVAGPVRLNPDDLIDRKIKRFMGDAAAYAYLAMKEAIADSKLTDDLVSNPRTGLIAGSGGASACNLVASADTVRNRGIKKLLPYMVPRTMSSTTTACLATSYKIKGYNYTISSACATSAHCIGNAYELIQMGKQDIVFAGGGEELDWAMTAMFDAMAALSSGFNATPGKASRAYDANRDGFVIAGGGGIVVVEELEHAKRRGAPIYAEITGYGATSDGADMVQPSGEGAIRCMQMALATATRPIDYINTHGTSTPVGDLKELEAIKATFGDKTPRFSSTKSLTGHSLGAAGVNEAIFCLLMMKHRFIAASANIETLDPAAEGMPVVRQRVDNVDLNAAMTNSFGFGGTNATLIMERV